MTKNTRWIWELVTGTGKVDRFSSASYHARKRVINREPAVRSTRGNARIQQNLFLTSEDLEKEREEARRRIRANQ